MDFDTPYYYRKTLENRIAKLEAENEQLKRIIAKELSENDALGSEFVYVGALKEQLRRYREALKEIKNVVEAGVHENGGIHALIAAVKSWCRQALEDKTT